MSGSQLALLLLPEHYICGEQPWLQLIHHRHILQIMRELIQNRVSVLKAKLGPMVHRISRGQSLLRLPRPRRTRPFRLRLGRRILYIRDLQLLALLVAQDELLRIANRRKLHLFMLVQEGRDGPLPL